MSRWVLISSRKLWIVKHGCKKASGAVSCKGETNLNHKGLLATTFLLCFLLAGCVVKDEGMSPSTQSLRDSAAKFYADVQLDEVEAIAKEADAVIADGWICGRDPRFFKSPYRVITPLQKAQFALAYRDFVLGQNQNLSRSLTTYIPYKKRSEFARKYWENSDLSEKFKAETEKYQVCWIHESLLDASELVFRAVEKKFGPALDSTQIMAHDVEQNMVSKYMEDERTESSFAWQLKGTKSGSSKSSNR